MDRVKFIKTDIKATRILLAKKQTPEFREYLLERITKREEELKELTGKENTTC